jgi:predicted dienelactone hydrolase
MRLLATMTTILAVLAPPAFAANVGFEESNVGNGAEAPLTVGIWYPTDAPATEHPLGSFVQTVAPLAPVAGHGLPLVVLSHGRGGSYESHYDTALALAHAGFVAAAVSHAGDTYSDQSQVLQLWRRPAQLRRLVSSMQDEWSQRDRLENARVGAFGFSNGGFAVLVSAGGIPDLGKTGPYCQANPYHDLCQALKQAGVDLGRLGDDVPPNAWISDARVRAVVIAAPAFGFAFDRAGLNGVHIPIQLWRAADDRHQPNPWYEEAVRLALPQPTEYHVIARAGHYDFLPPCGPLLTARVPQLCAHPQGFDRTAFHETFNAEVVRFFQTTLR